MSPFVSGFLGIIGQFLKGKNAKAISDNDLMALAVQVEGQLNSGALDIAKIQAQHRSLFVAGARPAILWAIFFGMTYTYILWPLGNGFAMILGYGHPFPAIDLAGLLAAVAGTGLLGGFRTIEKLQGKTK